jgi:hypothetical protein
LRGCDGRTLPAEPTPIFQAWQLLLLASLPTRELEQVISFVRAVAALT